METAKTSVQITQELLALVADHQEKLRQLKTPHERGRDYSNIIQALQGELSLSGDNVGSTVDRSDPYFTTEGPNEQIFKQAVTRLRENAGEIPESLQKIFDQLV